MAKNKDKDFNYKDKLEIADKQHKADEQRLKASYQQLQATEQQLRAANQQLNSNNQQLKATEQQLRAANQQLKADEQQLKAANQQLKADEQQLKAANQQIKASEKELRQSRARYKAIFDFSMNGIAVYEGIDGGNDFIFKNFNPAAEKIDKVRRQDLLGRSVQDVFPNIKKMGLLDVFRKVWQTGKEEYLPAIIYKDDRIEGWRENHVFKLQSGEIVAVYRDITDRKKAEGKIRKNHQQLRELTSKLASIEEQERKKIAEGIHDSIIQPLVFLDVKVKSLDKITDRDNLAQAYAEMRKVLAKLIEKSRTFTFDLSDPILYELGLEHAIEDYLQSDIEEKHEIKTTFEYDIKKQDLDQGIMTFLYKSIKELLVNILKHAEADNINVSLLQKRKNIIVCIEDNGRGFEASVNTKEQNLSAGFGLFNIREKADYMGGSLDIKSKSGAGSRVTLTIPLKSKL